MRFGEIPSLRPVGLSRLEAAETPICEPSTSVCVVVSFFSVATDRLEAACETRAIVLRTRLPTRSTMSA